MAIDLLNFVPAPKSVYKVVKSPKHKRLEIKVYHQELLKELKWKCSMIKSCLDKISQMTMDHGDDFIPVNFIGVVKEKLESLELQQKYNALEDKLKMEFRKIFEPIPHVKELPDDVYCQIKLKDATRTISKRMYGCPCKYWEAWKTLIDMHSVRRSSSLDQKYDRNRTEPNCKRPDHQLQLPTVGVSPVASCHVFGNI